MSSKSKTANGSAEKGAEHQDANDTTTTEQPPTSDNDGDAMDDNEAAKTKHWMESPFSVGLVNVTWSDEKVDCKSSASIERSQKSGLFCSAYCCSWLGAERVGNMAVLAQTTEEYDHVVVDEETGEQTTTRQTRPKLLCVAGPYWPVNLCLTYPLVIGISLWTAWKGLNGQHIALIVVWYICTVTMIFALTMAAYKDPGILYRHTQKPPGADNWRWNDQSKTYRPPKARYDPECAVVIEEFDHTCPWVGTAIGGASLKMKVHDAGSFGDKVLPPFVEI